jgi:hypothetical protein
MFNANVTRQQIAKTIQTYGMSITMTKANGSSIKTYGVFDEDKKSSDTTNSLSFTSPMTVGTVVCYIAATAKAPEVGDNLTGNNRSYNITGVEAYRPANVVIAYKLSLQ